MHCLCDRLQKEIHTGILGDLAPLTSDQRWIRLSAAKVVQDINDAARDDVIQCLDLLTDARTPNGEPLAAVAAYLGLVRKAYGRHSPPDWSDYTRLWLGVGLDRQQIAQIKGEAEQMLADAEMTAGLQATFGRLVDRFAETHPAIARKQGGPTRDASGGRCSAPCTRQLQVD